MWYHLTRTTVRAHTDAYGLLLNRPWPPDTLSVKVKNPWRSVSQLVRDPEAAPAEQSMFQLDSLFLCPCLPPLTRVKQHWDDTICAGQDGFKLSTFEIHWTSLFNHLFTVVFITYLLRRHALELWVPHKLYRNWRHCKKKEKKKKYVQGKRTTFYDVASYCLKKWLLASHQNNSLCGEVGGLILHQNSLYLDAYLFMMRHPPRQALSVLYFIKIIFQKESLFFSSPSHLLSQAPAEGVRSPTSRAVQKRNEEIWSKWSHE